MRLLICSALTGNVYRVTKMLGVAVMSRIYGEAEQDSISGTWKSVFRDSDGSVISETDYDFDSQREAEEYIIHFLQKMKEDTK